MKTGLLPLLAAAMLAAGCTKEARVPGLRILEEGMNGGSKVIIDPSNPTRNSWVEGETIGIFDGQNAAEYEIKKTESGDFYVDYTGRDGDIVAWYPYSAITYGDLAIGDYVSHYPTNVNSVTVPFRFDQQPIDDGKLKVDLQMVAFANAGGGSLMFRHVTGALAFDVVNNTGRTIPLSYIRVFAYRNDAQAYLWPLPFSFGDTRNGFVCSKNGNDISVEYLATPSEETCCHSYWDYYMSGIELDDGESFRCILPIPVTSAPTDFIFEACEYAMMGSGEHIISRTISGLTIERNHMYNLPTFYLAPINTPEQ